MTYKLFHSFLLGLEGYIQYDAVDLLCSLSIKSWFAHPPKKKIVFGLLCSNLTKHSMYTGTYHTVCVSLRKE